MMGFCGYNLCSDMDALNPFATNLDYITSTELRNATFDHINITENIETSYTNIIPQWDYDTILDCDCDENIYGGNIDLTLEQIDSVKIKRRKKGTFDWVTLKKINIKDYEDISFTTFDAFSASGMEYEYAVIPCLNDIEGDYSINTIKTNFNGVFICDINNIFKLFNGVSYIENQSIQSVGMLNPIGLRYPKVIINSKNDYQTIGISGTILNKDFQNNRTIDRIGCIEQREILDKILKNNLPKIIKDWNGNIWLVMITGNPNYTFNSNYGMGISNVSFTAVEQGKYDNQKDIFKNGLTEAIY